ncbi:MAG: hypothetical protein ACK4Y9_14135 [Hyphomonas sp.]
MPKLPMTAIALVALVTAAACESNGHTRYASVGTVGPGGSSGGNGQNGGDGADGQNGGSGTDGQNGSNGLQGPPGMAGPIGPAGPSGPAGPTGPAGPEGAPGGNFALGDAGLIATGGLIGPSGLGGTGLLANLGDPSGSIPVVSDVSTSAGTIVTSATTGIDTALGQANLPTELASVTGAVTATVGNVGGALGAFGTDGAPLVDGLTSSVTPLLTASLGEGTLAGDQDGSPLIGLSVLTTDQQAGTLAEVGVASGGVLLNADLSTGTDTALNVGNLVSADLGPVTGGLNHLLNETGLSDVTNMIDLGTAEDGLLADVTGNVSGLLSGEGDLSGLTAPAEDLLSGGGLLAGLSDPVEDLLSGGGHLEDLTGPVEGLLSGNQTPETPLTPVVTGVTNVVGGLLGGGWN